MVRLVLALGLVITGCYTPQLTDCADSCSVSNLCPDGLSCVDGFCRTAGAAGSCPRTGGVDASMQQTDAPMQQADAPMGCPPVPVAQGCTLAGPAPVEPNCFAACVTKTGTMAQAFTVGTWHIASIASATEQTAALTAANGQLAWIGLTQMPNQATPLAGWGWVGGGALTFAAWVGVQPDDANSTENNEQNCGALGPGGWGDESCADSHVFLIEPF
jgi:hypothetical protein